MCVDKQNWARNNKLLKNYSLIQKTIAAFTGRTWPVVGEQHQVHEAIVRQR